MSKKNIARTAIEGGRAKHCREAESEATQAERRYYKQYCREAARDPEAEEPRNNAFDPNYETGREFREFDDKLSAVKRWLESQVGRPWAKIASEVAKRFDRRTLAGRHILGHIDGFVSDKPEDDQFAYGAWVRMTYALRYPGELYVDEKGFLRQAPKIDKRRFYQSRYK